MGRQRSKVMKGVDHTRTGADQYPGHALQPISAICPVFFLNIFLTLLGEASLRLVSGSVYVCVSLGVMWEGGETQTSSCMDCVTKLSYKKDVQCTCVGMSVRV